MFIDLLESDLLKKFFKDLDIYEEYEKNINIILDNLLYDENYLRKYPDITNYNTRFIQLINDFSPQVKNKFNYDYSKVASNGIDSIISLIHYYHLLFLILVLIKLS